MIRTLTLSAFAFTLLLGSCKEKEENKVTPGTEKKEQNITISSLNYIGEQIIPDGEVFNSTTVGGLSSIDYANGTYYLISDDANPPIRFYEMSLTFDATHFSKVEIKDVKTISSAGGTAFGAGEVDPEAMRYNSNTGNLVWTSEGQIKSDINPSVREIDLSGKQVSEITLPSLFLIDAVDNSGPRHNGTLEGLSLSHNKLGYWLAMELPLEQDGEEPKLTETTSPIRITLLNSATKNVERQFVYELDKIVRDSDPAGGFSVNGLVEILAYDDNQFLVLERSFGAGHADGGNNVKIYKVDASSATDVKDMASLKTATYTEAKKTLLFDFETVRSSLTGGIVDNIEGITFGPDLANGNKSLVVVADNNFSAFGAQLNQFIVFEVKP